MFLLDTVAISETHKAVMDPAMEEFYASITSDLVYLSVVTIGELHFGLNLMPHGKRRERLREWIAGIESTYADKILGVDEQLGREWGKLRAEIRGSGFAIEFNDLLIAATAPHHDLTVVTRNTRHFELTGCKLLNPWETRE